VQSVGTADIGECTLSLQWVAEVIDLDLCLRLPPRSAHFGWISYRNLGALDATPWCRLEGDVQHGGAGPEQLHFSRFFSGEYQVWVHNFSDGEQLPRPTTFKIELGGHITELQAPVGLGRAWHVLDIDGATRRVTIVNSIQHQLPRLD
jgi:hypothetical protein